MKILIGGSPCTHWSIAQTKNRETEASGIGWELFLNYRIARDKYHPDYFLYENNKSMSPAIRAQITAELGVEPVLINSALVSAQNSQRLYWVGKREPDGTYSQVRVEQPEDKGILLRDILESGVCWREKGYALTASNHSATAEDMIARRQRNGAAEPIRIGTIENDAKKQDFDSQQYRVYSPDGKSVTLCGQGGGVGAKTGLYAVPVPVNETVEGKAQCLRATYYKDGIRNMVGNTVDRKTCVAMPVGMAAGPKSILVVTAAGKSVPVYEVRNGKIVIKGKEYPIKLADGFYIIRKLTVTECERLQTVPDTYAFPVSDTQAYKMLGNGWTVDVIAHIMSHFTGLTEEPVEVLSMYDGMSCGHIALDKLGADVTAYLRNRDRQIRHPDHTEQLPGDGAVGGCVSGAGRGMEAEESGGGGVMDCYDCKAKSVCAAVVQPGSVICLMNRMRYCGTHAEEEPRRQQGDYCQYCGHRLREIGRERFCNNVNCRNRYVSV